MALHRRVLQDVKFVCSFDPAVKSGYGDYKSSGYDFSKLEIHEGQAPTVFFLAQMSPAGKNLAANYSDRAKQTIQIQCALTKVDNFNVVSAVGESKPMYPVKREAQGLIGEMVTDEWVKDANLHQSIMEELSAAIVETSDPSPF